MTQPLRHSATMPVRARDKSPSHHETQTQYLSTRELNINFMLDRVGTIESTNFHGQSSGPFFSTQGGPPPTPHRAAGEVL